MNKHKEELLKARYKIKIKKKALQDEISKFKLEVAYSTSSASTTIVGSYGIGTDSDIKLKSTSKKVVEFVDLDNM